MPDAKRAMIVTGASSGIGRELALAAAREGFAVLLAARRVQRLDDVARAIRAARRHVRNPRRRRNVAGCAGTHRRRRAARIRAHRRRRQQRRRRRARRPARASDAAVDAQWQLHVAAPLRIARAALPHVEKVRGQLAFVGSGLSRVPMPEYGAYAPTKAAVRAAATQLRRELRARGIAVTYVDPGVVDTEFHGAMGVRRSSRIKAASPERVARAILRGIRRRAATVNAVPWQTAGTIALEWAATLADPLLARIRPPRHSCTPTSHVVSPAAPTAGCRRNAGAADSQPPPDVPTTFDAALEPVARRMERVKLSQRFSCATRSCRERRIELNELAMRWAGMPNKNERAVLREVLDALTAAGYLEAMGEGAWKVPVD